MQNAAPEGTALELQSGGLDNPAYSTSPASPATPRACGRKTDRHNPRERVTLAEPVKVAEFWKNRRGETIRATLVTYEGVNCFDVRQHFTAHDGRLQATKKGITIAVLRLPELADAVNRALTKARELGLIAAEGKV